MRPLNPSDLPPVAALHCAAFPHSALTQLGEGAVRRYYSWLLNGPHDTFAAGCELDGKLVGFVFGGRFRGAMTGFLQRNVWYLFLQLIRRPALWRKSRVRQRATMAWQLLRSARRGRRPPSTTRSSVPEVSFGVLALAVDPAVQRAGAGRALMAAATHEARARKAARMQLTVEPSNQNAVAFYERLGWRRQGEPFTGSMSYLLGSEAG